MSSTAKEHAVAVPAEEVARRIGEMRRAFGDRRLPPVVVYHPENHLCPWPSCGLRIAGIHFQLDKWADPAVYNQWLDSWWYGEGLLARCPSCGRLVLFGVQNKQAVSDVSTVQAPLLPDNWHQLAYLTPRFGGEPSEKPLVDASLPTR